MKTRSLPVAALTQTSTAMLNQKKLCAIIITAALTLIAFVSAAKTQSQNSRSILIRPAPAADQRIAYGSNEFQYGDLRVPKTPGKHPVAIVIHGGCWMAQYGLGYMGHASAALTEAGFATWNIEYRRVGNPGGGWPGTFEDVAKAADYLREIADKHSLDLNQVIAIGHSAGGHLALLLGARPQFKKDNPLYSANPLKLQGVVSLAGITDLRRTGTACDKEVIQFTGGEAKDKAAIYDQVSPINLLPLGVKQKIIQGETDTIIPPAMATDYIAASQKKKDSDVELILVKNADHFNIVDPQAAAWATVLETAKSLIKPGAKTKPQ
ncbi:MAG TPA: alpha/beta hydrolase [Blastocatellia bacterium]|nr:alpha/beta hydrolase [Blastocatellia bacterium]